MINKLFLLFLDELPLILLIAGIIVVSCGAFLISKIIGLLITGLMLIAVALLLAYQKGSDQ